MEFFDVVAARQSIRAYDPSKPLEPEKLEAILDAAVNRSPSAGNLQSYRVYVVKELASREALKRAAPSRTGQEKAYLTQAPVVLMFCADSARVAAQYGDRGAQLYAVQDAAIACSYAMLAATALGLSSLWVGSFSPRRVAQALGIPEGLEPVSLLVIGYPAEKPERRPRRPMSEMVHEVAL